MFINDFLPTKTNRQHLQIDVEMCLVALKLRQKERQLAQKVKDVKVGYFPYTCESGS